ncbi:hypothetical protein WMO13_06465 [Ignatzschineria larvae DSM 13226]|uniref:Uncharacterized protein n=1 Tax=Ignatzschineria larvae DSM 13226 TaxID=1111732 RepID=A0ABZ3C1N5_9GAMM|nr:hypothetical protein [Ignatzschineria larvae]
MKQFGRVISLKVGNEEESIEINGLRIAFDVEKTKKAEPNSTTISIYNLNDSNRDLLTSKEYDQVELSVGYVADSPKLIFKGDIIKVINEKDDLDIITTLKCADGYKAYTEAKTVRTMSAGQTDNDFVNEAIKDFEAVRGYVELPNDRALPRGKVFICNTRELMNDVAQNNNADWSIQDGELIVLPKDKALDEGYIISSDTGMIASPRKTDKGIEVTTLCNPEYKIGGLVRIQSRFKEYSGDFKIESIKHSGDTLADDWFSHLVCINGDFKNE